MSYNGDYLVALTDRSGPIGNRTWQYDTTDILSVVAAASYFSDAAFSNGTTSKEGKKGLRKGDIILVRVWSALPTDGLADAVSPVATAPTLTYTGRLRVTGIVAATGAATTANADYLEGSTTYDASNLADGAGETTTVTVTGAVLGDYVTGISLGVDLQGITVTGYVSATDTVSVRVQNESGGALNLASTTLRALVRPKTV